MGVEDPTLANFVNVTSAEQFRGELSKDLTRVSLINFWAPWAEPCKQMNQVVLELAKKYDNVLVLQGSKLPLTVEAETLPDITESFEIECVPSFIILRGHTLLERISGADAAALTTSISTHGRSVPRAQSQTDRVPAAAPDGEAVPEETPEQLEKRLRGLMEQSKVVLFMKGSPDAPRCGFSKKTVALLREQEVEFTHFDILTDESVRQGLKVLNNWPTFPQVIVNGELVGGLDVIQEAVESGEFKEILAA